MGISVKLAESTHIGNRKQNEDSMAHGCFDRVSVYIVADGMGGHSGGAFASSVFCEQVIERSANLQEAWCNDPKETVNRIVTESAAAMLDLARAEDPDMDPHTTFVLVTFCQDKAHIANLGDSRLYYIKNDGIRWRTRDHSVSQLLLDQGEIEEEDLATHPDQNKLYRFIGGDKKTDVSIKTLDDCEKGDTFLLCSDGFWTQFSSSEISSLYNSSNPQQDLEAMIEQACARADGKSDNITAQLLTVD